MELMELKIEKNRWGPHEGKHTGHACFAGQAGKVDLNLTPEMCDAIFLVCAEGILATAKEAAVALTCNVIEHQKVLERK